MTWSKKLLFILFTFMVHVLQPLLHGVVSDLGGNSARATAPVLTNDLSSLSSAVIKTITKMQIPALTQQQIQSLSAVQIPYFDVAQIKLFTATQIPYFKTSSPNQVAALTVSQIAALTKTQIPALTTQQVVALTVDQLVALTKAQIPLLTTTQVAALTTEQVAVLTVTQIKAFTSKQIAALTLNQVAVLTPTQVAALTPAQTGALATNNAGLAANLSEAKASLDALNARLSDDVVSNLTAKIDAAATDLAGLGEASSTDLGDLFSISLGGNYPIIKASYCVGSGGTISSITVNSREASLTNASLSAINIIQFGQIPGTVVISAAASNVETGLGSANVTFTIAGRVLTGTMYGLINSNSGTNFYGVLDFN